MDLSKLLSPPTSSIQEPFSPERQLALPAKTALRCPPVPAAADDVLPPFAADRSTLPCGIGGAGGSINAGRKDSMSRLLSPPVTPASRPLHRMDDHSPLAGAGRPGTASSDAATADPLLFAAHEPASSVVDQPLFALRSPPPAPGPALVPTPVLPVSVPVPPSPAAAVVDPNFDAIVTQHMAMHKHQFQGPAQTPTRDEYLLALSCISLVEKHCSRNPRRWLQNERRLLNERFGNAHRGWKRPTVPAAATTNTAAAAAAGAGLAKIAPAPAAGRAAQPLPSLPASSAAGASASVTRPYSLAANGAAARTARQARPARNPKPATVGKTQSPIRKATTAMAAATTGNMGVTAPAKRVIGTSREDTDFNALPDFAPPTSTLPPNNPRALKAEWRGQPLDLTNDPHRHLLHVAELHLASTLRLSCATYLCSKRRIFMARLDALRIGKEFRKTDSQQACKIDVNKASKLWSAYDRVGWFAPEHFAKYR